MMVNALVNLQDPILKTPENPATPVDASVDLQGLQEPIVAVLDVGPSLQESIFTLLAISPLPERVRLQEPIIASSAVTPPEGVRLQELIVTSSAFTPPERVPLQELIITSPVITPPLERVCSITEPFASSFPCAILILCLLSGSEPLGVTLIRPRIHLLSHTRSG
jgi:hypothetical protein